MWLIPAVIATLIGSVVLTTVYAYLYVEERKTYLRTFTMAWLIYSLRFVFMLLILNGYTSSVYVIGNQSSAFLSGMFLFWGTCDFLKKPFIRGSPYAVIAVFFWIVTGVVRDVPFFVLSFPVFVSLTFVFIWTGMVMLRTDGLRGPARAITGWTFILWGIHKAGYPFLRPVEWFAPWRYILGSTLSFSVALGIIMVHFKKNKDFLGEEIAGHKRARESLRESETMIRSIVATASDAIITSDFEGRIMFWNEAAERIFGYSADEVRGRHASLIISERLRNAFFIEMATVRKRGGAGVTDRMIESVGLTKDGVEIDIELSLTGWKATDMYFTCIIRDTTRRMLTEKKLQELYRMTSEILYKSPTGIYVVNGAGFVEYCNPAMLEISGGAYEQIVGSNIFELPTYQEPGLSEKIKGTLAGQSFDMGPVEYTSRRGGKTSIRNITGIPFESEDSGKALVFVEDVTKLMHAEKALKKSEQMHRNLFSSIRDVIVITDTGRNVINVNQPALKEVFGYELEEIVGEKMGVLYAGSEEYHIAGRVIFDGNREAVGKVLEVDFRKKNGKVFNGELVSMKLLNDYGHVIGNLGVIRDITERKRAEQELMKTSGALQAIILSSPMAIMALDPEGKVTLWNPAAHKIFGWDESEVVGHPHPLVSGEKDEEFDGLRKRVLSGESISGLQMQRRNKDGSTLHVSLSAAPLHDTAGKISGIISILDDITERVNIQNETFRSAQLASVGELAAGVAHEVNNPINIILLNSEIFLAKYCKNNEEKEMLKQIIAQSNRIANIVRSLLSFARVDRKSKRYVNIDDLIEDTLTLTQNILRKDAIQVRMDAGADLPEICVNPQRIEQVFINVINNARHALNTKYNGSHENKLLRIKTEAVKTEDDDFVRIIFGDNGTGMSDTVLQKAFNPFFTTKLDHGGTGLGLSISHRIMEEHEGTINIESKENEFTRVIIGLPVKKKGTG